MGKKQKFEKHGIEKETKNEILYEKRMNIMRYSKKFLTFVLIMILNISLFACSSDKPETKGSSSPPDLSGQWEQVNSESDKNYHGAISDKPETKISSSPPDLSGQWKQVNSESDKNYHGAIIDSDKIEIYWVSNNGDTRSLYWAGSFNKPDTVEEPYSWVSQNDTEKTSSAILASQDDTKEFTYTDNQITYSSSIMGITTLVRLEHEEWAPGLKIERNVQHNDEIPEENKHGGFDHTTNQTISFWGINFSFPDYFDVCAENSTDLFVHYYPAREDYYCSLIFYAEDSEWSQTEFDERKSLLADYLISRENNATEIKSEAMTIAGLSGWSMSYKRGMDTDNPSTVNICFLYHPNNKKVIFVGQGFDKKDVSNFNYVEDYKKIIDTATLVTAIDSDNTPSSGSGIRPEFKEAMESYEAFFDEYIAFMEKYSNSDDPLNMLSDYTNYMKKYEETMTAIEQIDDRTLSTEELSFYMEVQSRITQKLLTVAQ